jgi:S1-C subfamily serine protease
MGTVRRRGRSAPVVGLVGLILLGPAVGGPALSPDRPAVAAPDSPRPEDDATYRPTVMVRKGKSLGTGTIIASAEDETLILTASHVVNEDGPILVEFFRYNFGVERLKDRSGFPRKFPATIVARDPAMDLAILLIRKQLSFPYVARIASGVAPPPKGTAVTTIGFDKGEQLIGFSTKVRSVERIDLDRGGGVRSFVVTEDPPEIGRSGGGLFRTDGALVGVCVGRVELVNGRIFGIFTTLANIKAMIRANEDVATSMARANARPLTPAR